MAERSRSAPAFVAELFAIDLRSLALLRIGLGATLLTDLALRARDLSAHYGDAGVLPLTAYRALAGSPWSLHAGGGSSSFESALFAIHAAFAVALALGAHTRIATFGCWLLLTSLHHRNPFVLIAADLMLRLLLFWSFFLPLGARWSWDARRSAKPAREGRALGVASAALLLQVAAVYPIAAAWKRREPVWQELRFLREAMQVEGVATPLGRMLLELPESILAALTWLALQFETWAFALAFVPWATGPLRALAVALFLSFHLAGLGTTFSLGLFPVVMAVAWLPFVPPWLYERFGIAGVLPAPIPTARAKLVADFFAGCAAIGIAVHLAGTLREPPRAPDRASGTGAALWVLGLEQGWSLWSRPPTDRRYVFAARLRDGRSVDLHRGGAPLEWGAPRRRSANNRWWKYQLLVAEPAARSPHARLYAAELTRTWNEAHGAEEAVASLELWMLEVALRRDGDRPERRVRLWPP